MSLSTAVVGTNLLPNEKQTVIANMTADITGEVYCGVIKSAILTELPKALNTSQNPVTVSNMKNLGGNRASCDIISPLEMAVEISFVAAK